MRESRTYSSVRGVEINVYSTCAKKADTNELVKSNLTKG